jgi:hypothetical protein
LFRLRISVLIDQPASVLLQDIFWLKVKSSCRPVYGVASLPLGTPVEPEVIVEVG